MYVDTESVWRGGQEQLFGLMVGMRKEGHEVSLAAPLDSLLRQKAESWGVSHFPFRQRMELSLLAFVRLCRAFRGRNLDIVHFNTPKPILAGALAARLVKVPVILCSRRVNFPLRSRLSAVKYNWLLDGVFTVSTSIQKTLVRNGVREELIDVIYEGVDLDWIDSLRAPPTCFKGSGPVVGTVAHLSGEKGHLPLLEAAAILRRERLDFRLVLVGDGELRDFLELKVGQLGLEGQVSFAGFRDDSEAMTKQFDIFCLPSLSEGLSSAILAAMASRLPVVSTDVGGIPELVKDEETGYLVPPNDSPLLAEALRRLLLDSQLCQRMGVAGRRRVEELFTVTRKLKTTHLVYQRLIRDRRLG